MINVLVDSSVWIDFFNGNLTANVTKLQELIEQENILVGDFIWLEVLQGFRDDKEFEIAKSTLEIYQACDLLGDKIAIKAVEKYRTLRKIGITIRKPIDCVIATYCIENKIALLYSARDFDQFVEHLGLVRA